MICLYDILMRMAWQVTRDTAQPREVARLLPALLRRGCTKRLLETFPIAQFHRLLKPSVVPLGRIWEENISRLCLNMLAELKQLIHALWLLRPFRTASHGPRSTHPEERYWYSYRIRWIIRQASAYPFSTDFVVILLKGQVAASSQLAHHCLVCPITEPSQGHSVGP
jgi:hypothetical protein